MFYFACCRNVVFNSLLVQLVKYDVHTTRKIKFIHSIICDVLLFCFVHSFRRLLEGQSDKIVKRRIRKTLHNSRLDEAKEAVCRMKYTIQYKTCNTPYVTRMSFVAAGMTRDSVG